MLYRGMDRAQLDAAYNNSAAVPERDTIVADWAARSARVRSPLGTYVRARTRRRCTCLRSPQARCRGRLTVPVRTGKTGPRAGGRAGETTEKLLALLEQIPGVDAKFDGDLWKAVNWVQAEQQRGRLRGLDLDAPFRAPEKATSRD